MTGQWLQEAELGEPPKSSYNRNQEILITSLHWTSSERNSSLLMVTYMHHGILYANTIIYASLGDDTDYHRLLEMTDWTQICIIPLHVQMYGDISF